MTGASAGGPDGGVPGGDATPGSSGPRDGGLRAPVAMVVSRFPLITETFILRELDELERRGQPVRLVPLLREDPPVVHPEARPWVRRALFTPFLSRAILASNLRLLVRHPLRYGSVLLRLVAGTLHRPGVLFRTLALFPKAVHLGERLAGEGVRHLHGCFATYPATAAWVASRLFGLTFSFTAHAHDLFVHRALLGPKLRAARFVRAISRFNQRYLRQLYPAAREAGQVVVGPMGIEPERYDHPPPVRCRGEATDEVPGQTTAGARASGAPEGPVRVLCVAALKPYKGLPVLLESCRLLRQEAPPLVQRRGLVCDIVGEGPQRRSLERRIRRLGLGSEGEGDVRVRLLGARPQGEVARRMAEAEVFVLPSVVAPDGQMEGLPVVLMEALAARRPVVTTRLSGIPELVEDGVTGLLVEPGDAPALAAALERLLDDRRLARRLAEAGRRRVEEEFDLRRTAGVLAERFDTELSHRRRRERGGDGAPAAARNLVEALGLGVKTAGALGLRSFHPGTDATVLHLLLPRGHPLAEKNALREIVIKQARERAGQSRPPRERARWEYEVLERFHGAGIPVPRPVALWEEHASLAMEAVGGEALDDLLRGGRLAPPGAFRSLEADFRAAGAWLRDFQATTRSPQGVGRHGDFWPGNVRVGDGGWRGGAGGEEGWVARMTVLDWEGFAEGAEPEEDAAYFLVHAGLYLALPLLGGRRRRLEAAFLAGWCPGGSGEGGAARLAAAKAGVARRLQEPTSPPRARLPGHPHRSGGIGDFWRRRFLRSLAVSGGEP